MINRQCDPTVGGEATVVIVVTVSVSKPYSENFFVNSC